MVLEVWPGNCLEIGQTLTDHYLRTHSIGRLGCHNSTSAGNKAGEGVAVTKTITSHF